MRFRRKQKPKRKKQIWWALQVGFFFLFVVAIFFLQMLEEVSGVAGSCSTEIFECSAGEPYPAPPTSTSYQWLCLGTDGDSDASCSQAFNVGRNPAVCPTVFAPIVAGCQSGSYVHDSLDISGDTIDFRCFDSTRNYGYRTSANGWLVDCSLPKVSSNFADPICAQATNECILGISVNQSNVLGVNLWVCTIDYLGEGGNRSTTCSNNGLIPIDRTVDSINPPVDGLCSAQYGCIQGIYSPGNNLQLPDFYTTWSCLGLAGGLDADCSNSGQNPNNNFDSAFSETCGDQSATCASGIYKFGGIRDNVAYWSCSDPDNASDRPALCTFGTPSPDPISGVCGSEVNTCSSGTLTPSISEDPVNGVRWRCSGYGGGSSVICSSLNIQTDGKCGEFVNTCESGFFLDLEDSLVDFLWQCSGAVGGSNASCTFPIIEDFEEGRCSEDVFECESGESINHQTLSDFGSTNFTWTCAGKSGGASVTCNVLVEGDPVCGTEQWECIVGALRDASISSTDANWKCFSNNQSISCSSNLENIGAPQPGNNFENLRQRAVACKAIVFWDTANPTNGEVVLVALIVVSFAATSFFFVIQHWAGAVMGGVPALLAFTIFGCLPTMFLIFLIMIGALVVGLGIFVMARGGD